MTITRVTDDLGTTPFAVERSTPDAHRWLVWALLAEKELARLREDEALPTAYITAYAYARTGYHRSLDRLRANGWKGWGPVPASHEPNQGVLKAIAMLAVTSQAIGDQAEYDRCHQMLSDADPQSVEKLLP